MSRIEFTALALSDIDEIWAHVAIEHSSPVAADSLVDALDQKLRLLLEQPLIGEAVDRLRVNTRRVIVKKRYLVFYESIDDGIRVLRILHGARLIRPDDLAS